VALLVVAMRESVRLRIMIFRKKRRPGRKRRPHLVLPRAARRALDKARAPYLRKVIIWGSGLEKPPSQIARETKRSIATVYRWLARYRERGAEGLVTPRPSFPERRVPEEKVRRVRALLQGGGRSTRRIAALVGVSQSFVARLARAPTKPRRSPRRRSQPR